jgi:hypothetical protein
MSINDLITKIKSFSWEVKNKIYSQEKGLKIKNDVFIVLLIIFVGTASFGFGRISAYEKKKTPISVLKMQNLLLSNTSDENDSLIEPEAQTSEENQKNNQVEGLVFASKSGKKYYYPWCSGASRIKEENKIWFSSIEAAKAAGYTPAVNCPGLK